MCVCVCVCVYVCVCVIQCICVGVCLYMLFVFLSIYLSFKRTSGDCLNTFKTEAVFTKTEMQHKTLNFFKVAPLIFYMLILASFFLFDGTPLKQLFGCSFILYR